MGTIIYYLDEPDHCPTCGQSIAGLMINNSRRFRLDQFAIMNDLDVEESQLHTNVDENAYSGDPEHEINYGDQVYIENDLEPGQLIFINSISPEMIEEVNEGGEIIIPAMFIECENLDNALYRVLNLDT